MKAPVKQTLNEIAEQLLDVAAEFELQQDTLPEDAALSSARESLKRKADAVGDISDDLECIARYYLGYDIRFSPPRINQAAQPAERLAGQIQTLVAAAVAVEPEDDEIAGKLREMAAGLARV